MGVDAQMLVKTKTKLSEGTVRRIAYQLGAAFGYDSFFIDREGKYCKGGRHCLEIIKEYCQDGPSIKPKKGEMLINVHLGGRYYGEDYERGDATLYIAVAQFLEHKIPNAEIWYGGDSSGCVAELFNKEARDKLFNHFAEYGHEPYSRSFSMKKPEKYPTCEFCGDVPMIEYGWGGGKTRYYCAGCNYRVAQDDKGVITPFKEGDEKW